VLARPGPEGSSWAPEHPLDIGSERRGTTSTKQRGSADGNVDDRHIHAGGKHLLPANLERHVDHADLSA
jgi:hypothetical protein